MLRSPSCFSGLCQLTLASSALSLGAFSLGHMPSHSGPVRGSISHHNHVYSYATILSLISVTLTHHTVKNSAVCRDRQPFKETACDRGFHRNLGVFPLLGCVPYSKRKAILGENARSLLCKTYITVAMENEGSDPTATYVCDESTHINKMNT